MNLKPSLTAFMLLGLSAAPSLLQAQTVSWGAIGLPPGMSVSSAGANTVKIFGTPKTPGNYKAVIFPKIGNVAGDMVSVPITVLPAGVSLPVYYGYNRVTTNGGSFTPLAGGSGYLFGGTWSGNSVVPLFTRDGINFIQQTIPSSSNPLSSGFYNVQAAVAGSRCLVCCNGVMTYSDNQGPFKTLALPSGITGAGYSGVGGNGSNRFFLAYHLDNTNSIQLYSMQNNQTNWTSRGTFNLQSNVTSFYSPYISVAVNGSLLVMSIQSDYKPVLLLTSIDGGNTWTANNSNPGIISIAYGNGIFLGTGNGGVWTSSNGINWTKTSSKDVGFVIYSQEGYFFSGQNGVSKDGNYWLPYGYGTYQWGDNPLVPVSSGSGLIFLKSGQQVSSTYIPPFYASSPHVLNVGNASDFTLQLDTANSGSISQ